MGGEDGQAVETLWCSASASRTPGLRKKDAGFSKSPGSLSGLSGQALVPSWDLLQGLYGCGDSGPEPQMFQASLHTDHELLQWVSLGWPLGS